MYNPSARHFRAAFWLAVLCSWTQSIIGFSLLSPALWSRQSSNPHQQSAHALRRSDSPTHYVTNSAHSHQTRTWSAPTVTSASRWGQTQRKREAHCWQVNEKTIYVRAATVREMDVNKTVLCESLIIWVSLYSLLFILLVPRASSGSRCIYVAVNQWRCHYLSQVVWCRASCLHYNTIKAYWRRSHQLWCLYFTHRFRF